MTDGLVRWANRYTRGFDNVQPVSDLTGKIRFAGTQKHRTNIEI